VAERLNALVLKTSKGL